MSAFISELDLGPALRDVAERGASQVPRALDERFRRALRRELFAGPYENFEESFGRVRQQIAGFDLAPPFDGFPLVAELSRELTTRVRSQGRGIRGLATWRVDEAGIARYRPGSIGITPHLDGKWYRRLIVVVTVWGSARFSHCSDREGRVIASWGAGPGSLTLMRGPGLGGVRDGRPFHSVGTPRRGERCSLGLRMSIGAPAS